MKKQVIGTNRILRAGVALAAVAFSGATAQAEYYDIKNAQGIATEGADILYQETRYPKMMAHLYNARFYPSFGDAQKKTRTNFYSGPAMGGNNEPGTIEANYIQSFWGITNPINAGDSVTAEYWNPHSFAPLAIGEGASGKVDGRLTMSSNVWYPGVVRVWRPTGEPQNVSKIGQWIKDGVTGKWMLFGIFHVPFAATQVLNDGGFIEDPATGARNQTRVDFRNYYFRKNGAWVPAQNLHGSARQKGERGTIELIENGTAASFTDWINPAYTGNIDFDGNGGLPKERTVTMTMPETPTFDPLQISAANAQVSKGQLNVSWELDEKSAPQFAYKIEVFPTANTTGAPALTVENKDPVSQNVLIPYAGAAAPRVRLTLTSVFDQSAAPLTVAAAPATLAPARAVAASGSGLNYRYFEGADWTNLPDFATLAPAQRSGAVTKPDLSIRQRGANYATQYQGFLDVPADGIWSFSVKSAHGSRLIVDGTPLVDSDGLHSAGYETVASRGLKAGKHPVEVQFFQGPNSSRVDNNVLQIQWQGPGVDKSPIPARAWSRTPGAGEPTIAISAPAPGASVAADAAHLTATVMPAGQPLQSVRFYEGDTVWGTAEAATSQGKARLFRSSETLGAGPGVLKARLIYGDKGQYTLDSAPVSVTVTQPDIAPWQFSAIGPHRFPAASSVAGQTHTLVGDNLNFNWQQITGDTTIIAQIKRRPGNAWVSQFDGSSPDNDWSGGILFRGDLIGYPGSEIGKKFVALFASAGNTIHFQDNTNHNPGGYYWPPSLQNNARSYAFLKLKREGDLFSAFLSEDGLNWTPAGTRDLAAQKFGATMYVGVYTLARPGGNPNPNRWRFANVAFAQNAAQPRLAAGTYTLQNAQSGLYLDSAGATRNGSDLGQSNAAGDNAKFVLSYAGGAAQLKSASGNLHLDSMGRTAPGSLVGQWSPSGSANQLWQIEAVGAGVYTLINQANGKALDASGGKAVQFAPVNSSGSQGWKLAPVK